MLVDAFIASQQHGCVLPAATRIYQAASKKELKLNFYYCLIFCARFARMTSPLRGSVLVFIFRFILAIQRFARVDFIRLGIGWVFECPCTAAAMSRQSMSLTSPLGYSMKKHRRADERENMKINYFFIPFCSPPHCFHSLQINLRLILVSGKTQEFLFCPSDSAGDIARTVFEQWPEGEFCCCFIFHRV